MTENELDEWREAQREKCQTCRRGRLRCESNGRQELPTPEDDYLTGYRTGRVNDTSFFTMAFDRYGIRECWRPVLARSTCVGYERRPE